MSPVPPVPGLVRIGADAGAAKMARVTALLARAFQDDPMMAFAFPDAVRRARSLPRLIGLNVRYMARHGEVYTTMGMEGAALWLPPDQTQVGVGGMLRVGALVAPLTVSWSALRRMSAMGSQGARLRRQHAPMPHWYLSQIGVEPAMWGRGFAGTLLAPMLARMDAEKTSCYLETGKEGNVALYQRYGFAVAAARELGGSLRVWAMLRHPAGG